MTDIKCLDSSAWLSYYFKQSFEVKEIIEKGDLILVSSLALFEVKKRLISLKKDPAPLLILIKERCVVIMPTIKICEKAAEISIEKNLAAIDSLIYTTSNLHDCELITGDNDFRGLDKVKII